MQDDYRELAHKYRDTMGLTREGAFRRIDVLCDAIEALVVEVERRTYDGIHTCSDACQRPLCVLRRENAALVAEVEFKDRALKSLANVLNFVEAKRDSLLVQVKEFQKYPTKRKWVILRKEPTP